MLIFYDLWFLGVKKYVKRVHRNDKKNLPWDFFLGVLGRSILHYCYKFSFSPRYIYTSISGDATFLFFFFLVWSREAYFDDKYETNHKISRGFSRSAENKNIINISSLQNLIKFIRLLLKSFDFMNWLENICHSRSKRQSQGQVVLLFITNIIKYEIRFLSSQQ